VLIRDAELASGRFDVRIRGARIAEIGRGLVASDAEATLDARAGALLPGLHDHHIHLQALAAKLASLDCGPSAVPDFNALTQALRRALPARGWIRGTGYFESVAGPLNRDAIDAMRADIPVRIQHRSGAMWFLNSRAIKALDLDSSSESGLERDTAGRVTGRIFRADDWLRERWPSTGPPDLAPVGRLLSRLGVTQVTDCTPTNGEAEWALLRSAQERGALPQRVEMMGRLDTSAPGTSALQLAAHKIMLDEPALPPFETLCERIARAHAAGRPVAFHTVTRVEAHFALAALESAGASAGDRLEHASVAPPELLRAVAHLGVAIVTQPHFIRERGDDYLAEVEARDQPHLYRLQSWLTAGVSLRGGTDAPFGVADPWRAMRAAVQRRTNRGIVLGPDERLSPESALALFLPDRIRQRAGALERRPPLLVGDPADLCLLGVGWQAARQRLTARHVAATWREGRLLYSRELEEESREEASPNGSRTSVPE